MDIFKEMSFQGTTMTDTIFLVYGSKSDPKAGDPRIHTTHISGFFETRESAERALWFLKENSKDNGFDVFYITEKRNLTNDPCYTDKPRLEPNF